MFRRDATCSAALASRVEDIVVQTLRYEEEIRAAEVHGEGDDCGDEARPSCAEEVGDIAEEPDGEEEEGDALGGLEAVVFD
jgi:hypothetical protein